MHFMYNYCVCYAFPSYNTKKVIKMSELFSGKKKKLYCITSLPKKFLNSFFFCVVSLTFALAAIWIG